MNKKSEKYLSIGQISKLTNVNIKSLRYYDEIGILTPAYVDPKNGYRYYTAAQISIVDAIQFCVELDIPLKNFHRFLSKNKDHIYYKDLIEYGTILANEKINTIQNKLKSLDQMQLEIERSEELKESNAAKEYDLPEKLCGVVPYEGNQSDPNFGTLLNQLYIKLKENGAVLGYDIGMLSFWTGKQCKSYMYVELLERGNIELSQTFTIPAGRYRCKKVDVSSIDIVPQIFPDLFQKQYDKLVVECELFTGNYKFVDPLFELRCSISS